MAGRHKIKDYELSLDEGVVGGGEGDRGSVDTVGEGSSGVVDCMVGNGGGVDKRS